MGGEDIIPFRTCGSYSANDRDEACNMNHEHDGAEVLGFMPNGENLGQIVGGTGLEKGQLSFESGNTGDVIGDSSSLHERFDCIEKSSDDVLDYAASQAEVGSLNAAEVEEGQIVLDMSTGENACIENADYTGTVEESQRETVTKTEEKCADVLCENSRLTENETSNSYPDIGGGSTSSAKRMRDTLDEQQPSVHVKYHGLSRQGKRKLEELLREWSEWTAQNCPISQGKNQESESGEGTYFPALDIGIGKTSTVSFWVENEIRKPQSKDFTAVEDDCAPLYDREFALGLISADGSSNLEGGLELLEAPRCFNCGSYSHSLKECPKPRDNVAVNNSRKQLKARRYQIAGARHVVRYYQDSPGGKYEGLKPGVLDAETRRLLGLGELDPPPWLSRMREIGYPPGYVVPEDENLPSGIAIYAEEESHEDKEDGEILETEVAEPQKKMTVEFPGLNAPIPHNADERLWAARPLNPDRHRTGEWSGSNHSSEFFSRGRYREHSSRGIKDEDQFGFERASRHPSRYDDDFGNTCRSSRDIVSGPRSSRSVRSVGDTARNDPSDSEDSLVYRLYSSYSYSSSRRFSEHSNGLDVSRGDRSDYSSRDKERFRHRSGR